MSAWSAKSSMDVVAFQGFQRLEHLFCAVVECLQLRSDLAAGLYPQLAVVGDVIPSRIEFRFDLSFCFRARRWLS